MGSIGLVSRYTPAPIPNAILEYKITVILMYTLTPTLGTSWVVGYIPGLCILCIPSYILGILGDTIP